MWATLGFIGAIGGTVIYLLTSLMILSVLKKRGESVSLWLLPMRAFTYARQFKAGLSEEDSASQVLYILFYAAYGTAMISLFVMLIAVSQ